MFSIIPSEAIACSTDQDISTHSSSSFTRLGDPFQVILGALPVSLGVRNMLPGSSLSGKALEKIRLTVVSNSFAGIVRTQFSMNVNPVVSDVQLLNPGVSFAVNP